jgi:cell division protein FtsW (lipid II flippase)
MRRTFYKNLERSHQIKHYKKSTLNVLLKMMISVLISIIIMILKYNLPSRCLNRLRTILFLACNYTLCRFIVINRTMKGRSMRWKIFVARMGVCIKDRQII